MACVPESLPLPLPLILPSSDLHGDLVNPVGDVDDDNTTMDTTEEMTTTVSFEIAPPALHAQPLHLVPRPDVASGVPLPHGAVDTSTLAAHDFDVDTRTGFMPPDPPLRRLPAEWEAWEQALDEALESRLQLGAKVGLSEEERAKSAAWREKIRQLPVLPTHHLDTSELLLRRAHHVLGYLIHFYIHTQPPQPASSEPIVVPRPIGIPQLQVCRQLRVPPVVTYSDDVLYNWAFKSSHEGATHPTPENIACLSLFTGTPDEEAFYLSSARIELLGVRALSLMQLTLDELFISDALAISRITAYLAALAPVVRTLTDTLLAVRDGCDPTVFYNDIRPWFKGEDSSAHGRRWLFDGVADYDLPHPTELSGPSAGQSALVHALDVFLGVDHYTPPPTTSLATASTASAPKETFMKRMQTYMPRHHRAFLDHLATASRPLRALILAASDPTSPDAYNPDVVRAYDEAVRALKSFRDAHMRIVALYIVGPARKAAEREAAAAAQGGLAKCVEEDGEKGRWLAASEDGAVLKGTGGTELVRFLKGVRDRTACAVVGDKTGN